MVLSADERHCIEEELAKSKAMASKVVETIAFVNNAMARVRDQSYETMAEIRSAADRLILEVRAREEKLIKKVTEILDWKEETLQQQKKSLEDFLGELQQSIDYTSDILNKPDNQDIDEWKTALSTQLKSLQNMKDEYVCEPDVDGMGFVFLYEDEQLLNSMANYGTVIANVKAEDNYDKKESRGMSGMQVIPVITLNGLIVDLDEEVKKNYMDSDSDSSDDEDDDDESDDEESETGSGDDDHDQHGDSDDDDDDSNDKHLKNERKTVHSINDDNTRLRQNDKVSDGIENPKEKYYSNQPNLGKTMASPKANKVQKLSTLL